MFLGKGLVYGVVCYFGVGVDEVFVLVVSFNYFG